jgi:hypothetical protein
MRVPNSWDEFQDLSATQEERIERTQQEIEHELREICRLSRREERDLALRRRLFLGALVLWITVCLAALVTNILKWTSD